MNEIQRAAGRGYWNKLYRRPDYVYGTAPNRYLCDQTSRLRSGTKALVLGDGEARNGVWLAAQGLNVISVDWSPYAIAKGKRLAHHRNVSLTFQCRDLLNWEWPLKHFALVVSIFLHLPEAERKLIHHNICQCLRPGGLLILEAFHRRHGDSFPRSQRIAESFYTADLVRQEFSDLEILELLEKVATLDEGWMHQGPVPLVRFVGRKPEVSR